MNKTNKQTRFLESSEERNFSKNSSRKIILKISKKKEKSSRVKLYKLYLLFKKVNTHLV